MPPKQHTNGKLHLEREAKPSAGGGLYLSLRALEGLKSYAYKPSGYTVLDDLHQPVWNYITNNWLPLWLAPNLITLMGVWALLAAYALGVKYLPEFAGPAPAWLPAVNAAAVFFYLHMDCLDGKQARRTKNSSPLGQLFDHGCDAMAVHLVLMGVACTLQVPQGWFLITSCFCVFGPWLLAHWEEYHTGIMVYGNGYFGVTEANYAVVALHLWGYLMGQQGWLWRPFAALARSSLVQAALPQFAVSLLAQLQLNHLLVLTVCSLAVLTGGQQILRVFRLSGSKQLEHTTLPKRERGHKQLGKAAAAAHIAQFALFFGLGAAMLGLAAPKQPGQARVAHATFGMLYALQATKLIMAHMSKEPFEVTAWPLVVMAVQVANHFVPFADAVLLNYSVCAVSLVLYLHYVVSMVREICSFLGIPCLTVRKVD